MKNDWFYTKEGIRLVGWVSGILILVAGIFLFFE